MNVIATFMMPMMKTRWQYTTWGLYFQVVGEHREAVKSPARASRGLHGETRQSLHTTLGPWTRCIGPCGLLSLIPCRRGEKQSLRSFQSQSALSARFSPGARPGWVAL